MIDFAVETLFNLHKLARKLFTTGKYIPDIDVIDIDGIKTIQFRDVALTQYETLILTCPDDGKQYRVIRTMVDGITSFRPVPIDYVEAGDGNIYQLRVILVDGVPTIDEPQLV